MNESLRAIAEALQFIALVPSTNEKKALLKKYGENSTEFRKVLMYALNPFDTYGITSVTLPSSAKDNMHSSDTIFKILNELRERKLTGNSAREALDFTLAGCTKDVQELIVNILNKDLRCGVGTTLANKALPDLHIPTFECMLADHDKPIRFSCNVEPKFDGVRCLAIATPLGISYYSRNGKAFENFSSFNDTIALASGTGTYVFDGEVVGTDFNQLMTMARRKNATPNNLRYMVFDMLTLQEFSSQNCTLGYTKRRERMTQVFKIPVMNGKQDVQMVQSGVCNSSEELEEAYQYFVQQGYEGVIVKDPLSHYHFKRSKAWIKMKPTSTIDVTILGWEEGKGKFTGTFGALVVDVDGIEVRVGSGFSDEMRKHLWCERESIYHKVAEVKYQEKTPDGSLRFPVFVQMRPDKSNS